MTKSICKIFLLAFFSCLVGCSEDFSNDPSSNQPPNTFTSIFSDNELNPVTSRQTLHWWGDDPDGVVIGFAHTFDSNATNIQTWDFSNPDPNWHFDSTRTEETFSLTLTGSDTTYTFWVKAIDNDHAADPDGAQQRFPVTNTRPVVEFPLQTDVPETTFTVAAFTWSATDLDGDDTIASFEYVLDDTSNDDAWTAIPANQSNLTLKAEDGLTAGEHVLFLRAIDVAGARSDIVRMPRDDNSVWFVREPQSTFLVIDDYNIADNTDVFYQSSLRTIVGAIDVWDIKSNGHALEPVSSVAFRETLLLFSRIFWYTDAAPNLAKAQVAVQAFLDADGKIIMASQFQEFSSNQGAPLDFSPVDSLGTKINRITRDLIIEPTAEFRALGFPDLQVNTAIIPNVFPLVPKISSKIYYVLPEGPNWIGRPPVGVINGASTFIFFGLPLASLDGLGTVNLLLEKTINEIWQ